MKTLRAWLFWKLFRRYRAEAPTTKLGVLHTCVEYELRLQANGYGATAVIDCADAQAYLGGLRVQRETEILLAYDKEIA